jgi:hypothetical protein
MGRIVVVLGVLIALGVLGWGTLWFLGQGRLGEDWDAGEVTEIPIPAEVVSGRAKAQRVTARIAGVAEPKQVLFGDLHVHSTFSTDAFIMSLPMTGGDGARPVSDACDFARFCSALDFWSINDHALALTPRRWDETVEAVRQCNDVAGDPRNPDVVAYLGWEWTQMGLTPETHYGHKNVILRDLDDAQIPARPISAGIPQGGDVEDLPGSAAWGLLSVLEANRGGPELVRYMREQIGVTPCAEGVPVRDLPEDCIEYAPTPDLLFEKLRDWDHEAMVIPHGTTWGFYTPQGSSWDKQLDAELHDPRFQRLVEIYSGHGNSEEYRSWREVVLNDDGTKSCPEPVASFLPSCWKAGEIIRTRCLGEDGNETVCDQRASDARQYYVDGDVAGFLSVPGTIGADWEDSGQCRDCFQPSFNYRPKSSAQYMMALTNFEDPADPLRFRFGFMAASDNHSSRPGTGYKEYRRDLMTELRFKNFGDLIISQMPDRAPIAEAAPFDVEANPGLFFGVRETERQGSFFLTGGLAAVHSTGRSREDIWDALQRREVYGTSGPRILLWFDLIDPASGDRMPMGSEISSNRAPTFQVRALGSFEQNPGCPEYALSSVGPEEIERLCAGECYNPSGERRDITRIEVVRIRPQSTPGESVDALIEDPWKVIACAPDAAGCRVTFSDPEFETYKRDTLYYARAIEEPTPTQNADSVGCLDVPVGEDCLSESEHRAWSSPIFVDHP